MKRDLASLLDTWKTDPERMPLLLRGARQVGKSYLVQQWGEKQFENVVEINFEYEPQSKAYFTSLNPHEILNKIRLATRSKINPGQTLLFLDEVQQCPKAILALRYFYEKLPQLHVIAAGSLLEFCINDTNFEMPVGRVQSLYMRPLSFMEFLTAKGLNALRSHLDDITLEPGIEPVLHDQLLKLIREYMIVSGMPKPLRDYLQFQDMTRTSHLQTSILRTYQDDFGKYATKIQHGYLQALFNRAPRLIAKNFVFKDVDPNIRSKDIRMALNKLEQSGLLLISHAVSAEGIPLSALIKEKNFKIFMLDVGLVSRACGLSPTLSFAEDIILVNRGMLAEQLVAQELIAYSDPYQPYELFWWHRSKRGSTAEVDFVIAHNAIILPIEVKAGEIGNLRSMKIFMEEKKSLIGVRISQRPLAFEQNILSVPFYMIKQIPRLLSQVI